MLSTDVLVELAKRIVHGPRSWSTSTHQSPNPVLACEIVLSPDLPPNSLRFGSEDEVKLLPGGQQVLFTNRGKLRCWSVVLDIFIWEYQGHWDSLCVTDFAADVIGDGRVAMIIIAVSVPSAFPCRCVTSSSVVCHTQQIMKRSICGCNSPGHIQGHFIFSLPLQVARYNTEENPLVRQNFRCLCRHLAGRPLQSTIVPLQIIHKDLACISKENITNKGVSIVFRGILFGPSGL